MRLKETAIQLKHSGINIIECDYIQGLYQIVIEVATLSEAELCAGMFRNHSEVKSSSIENYPEDSYCLLRVQL